MTNNGKQIIEKIKKDSKLKEVVKNCKTKEEVIKILNQNGLKCTIADFQDANANSKISLEELKKVSGGAACVCVFLGYGYHFGPNWNDEDWRCGCYVAGEGDCAECYCACALAGGGQDK